MIEIDTWGKALFYPVIVPIVLLLYAFFLMGGGHAPFILYIPYLLIAGPIALLAFYIHINGDFIWILIGGVYLLYSLYALILFLLADSKSKRDKVLGAIFLLHCVCIVLFYLSDQ